MSLQNKFDTIMINLQFFDSMQTLIALYDFGYRCGAIKREEAQNLYAEIDDVINKTASDILKAKGDAK